MKKNYTVILDEICQEHGGRNFVYQYDDENFERIESACEGCTNPTRKHVSREPRIVERPQRPPRRS